VDIKRSCNLSNRFSCGQELAGRLLLVWIQLFRTAETHSALSRRFASGAGSFADEIAFEFRVLRCTAIGRTGAQPHQQTHACRREGGKARGVKFGRKPKLTVQQIGHARKLIEQGEAPQSVAGILGVSRATIYRALVR